MLEVVQRKDFPEGLMDNLMRGVFHNSAGEDYYRFDFALLCHDGNSVPTSFVTCKEVTKDDVYVDFGGTFPNQRGYVTYRNIQDMIKTLSEKYQTVFTHVQNTNYPMLKLYLHEKFEIIGVRVKKDGRIFCELKKELRG